MFSHVRTGRSSVWLPIFSMLDVFHSMLIPLRLCPGCEVLVRPSVILIANMALLVVHSLPFGFPLYGALQFIDSQWLTPTVPWEVL